MRLLLCTILLSLSALLSVAQQNSYPYQQYFEEAYDSFPNVPRGMLEAIAYTNTRIHHLTPLPQEESCTGMPLYYGVMGLVEDGKGYFVSSLTMVRRYSRYSIEDIKNSPRMGIMACAAAITRLTYRNIYIHGPWKTGTRKWEYPIAMLSEIPNNDNYIRNPWLSVQPYELAKVTVSENIYASDLHLYAVLSFLKNRKNQSKYNFPDPGFELEDFFDEDFLELMEAPFINVTQNGNYARQSSDYGPAIWDPTTCNFSARSAQVSAVTVHVTQGSYAGTISWFKNCSANVSAHYVIRSSDGQITQMVAESDKGWHVGSENDHTIGIEHEGFVNDPAWFTQAMYNSSADLVKDITSDHNINPLSTYKGTAQQVLNACYGVKGHVHFPNQSHTDPGVNWDWPKYYDLINDQIAASTLTACSGTFTDNGGAGSNYANFERYIVKVAPPNASEVSMDFSSFSTEEDYDFLHIYNGPDIDNSPLIGSYSGTTSPGLVTANSGVMTLLFESDCIINSTGWEATWSCKLSCAGNLAVNSNGMTNESCTNAGDGTLSIIASGGSGPYTYEWSNGGMAASLINLVSGQYTVTVTDGQGCQVVEDFSVEADQDLVHAIIKEDASCFGYDDGIASISVQGGNLPYSYLWNDGNTSFLQTGLAAGWHYITVTDVNGCNFQDSVFIDQPGMMQLGELSIAYDTVLASYTVKASGLQGAVPPISYQWSNGGTDSMISNVLPGSYGLVITDSRGCRWDTLFTLLPMATGLNEVFSSANVKVFPNPSKGKVRVQVELERPADLELMLYDINGKRIWQRQLDADLDSQVDIDGTSLPAGIYTLLLRSQNDVATRKVVFY